MALNFSYIGNSEKLSSTARIAGAENVFAFDFNHDGLKDLFVAPSHWDNVTQRGYDPDLPVRIFLNRGGFKFEEATETIFSSPIPVTGYTNHPALIADFNNDGFDDIFLVDSGQEITMPWDGDQNKLLLSKNDGKYEDRTFENLPEIKSFNHHGTYGDIDNDGDIDILISALTHVPNSYFLVNDGNAVFSLNTDKLPKEMVEDHSEVRPWRQPGASVLADVNSDGRLDIVSGSYKDALPTRQISVLLQNTDGIFIETQNVDFHANFTDGGINEIVSADFDNDGDPDFLVHIENSVSGKGHGVMALRNDAGALVDTTDTWFPSGFMWREILPLPFGGMFIPSTGFYLRDFNSDGQMDFGLAHFSLQIETPGSYIFINTGDGFDQATHANGVSNNTGWDDPGIIPIFDDFDNDGDVDIAGFRAAGYTSFYTDVLENNLIQTLSGNNDQFTGTEYRDIVYSSDGNDLAQANAGDDLLWGQSGNDTLSGGAGHDLIYGNQDADRIVGGTGMDTLFGGQQSDIVFGLTGADQVYGNKQNDTLYGGVGDDSMFGGQNDDLVFGEIGNDRMDGNRGSDTLFGGDGADRFVISKGNDLVQDFSVAEDRIETLDAFSAINQAVINGSLVLTDTDGDTLTLIGVSSTLTEEYFI